MPKMTERERFADLEARQRKIAADLETARRALRATYAGIAARAQVEELSEREFRDILSYAIRAGGGPAVQALKGLPAATPQSTISPERRPSDEHGGAARRRPAAGKDAASAGDGAGR